MTSKKYGIQVRKFDGTSHRHFPFVCKDVVHAREVPFATDLDTATRMADKVNAAERQRACFPNVNKATLISWRPAPLWSAPVVSEVAIPA